LNNIESIFLNTSENVKISMPAIHEKELRYWTKSYRTLNKLIEDFKLEIKYIDHKNENKKSKEEQIDVIWNNSISVIDELRSKPFLKIVQEAHDNKLFMRSVGECLRYIGKTTSLVKLAMENGYTLVEPLQSQAMDLRNKYGKSNLKVEWMGLVISSHGMNRNEKYIVDDWADIIELQKAVGKENIITGFVRHDY
jgi:hypothetical protein